MAKHRTTAGSSGKFKGYDEDGKKLFLAGARRSANLINKALNLGADVRVCRGGIAVSGEVDLHGDDIYLSLGLGCGPDLQVLLRRCNGKKDSFGGPNNWARWEDLRGLERGDARILDIIRALRR